MGILGILVLIAYVITKLVLSIQRSRPYRPTYQPPPAVPEPPEPEEPTYEIISDDVFEYKKFSDHAIIVKHIAFDPIENLILPDEIDGVPITEIGEKAFASNQLIKKVVLPDSIVKIGKNAFHGSSLEQLNISKSLREIGDYASLCCAQFCPDSSKEIVVGSGAFKRLGKLELTQNMKCNYSSFSWCGINKLEIENGVSHLEITQFAGNSMEEIAIPSTITAIPDMCFNSCKQLRKVLIPSSVQSISKDAFQYSEYDYPYEKADGTPDYRYNPVLFTGKLDITFYCEAGSYAQDFAKRGGYKFRPMEEYFNS